VSLGRAGAIPVLVVVGADLAVHIGGHLLGDDVHQLDSSVMTAVKVGEVDLQTPGHRTECPRTEVAQFLHNRLIIGVTERFPPL
jgi:hypothetical protein